MTTLIKQLALANLNLELTKKERVTIESYDKAVAFRVSNSSKEFWKDQFENLRKYLPSGKIIDIGCGTGIMADVFSSKGYIYTGIDASFGLLEEAKKQTPTADFRKINIYDLQNWKNSGLLDDYFNGFWAVNSLIHIPKKKIDFALKGIKRIVKNNGFGQIIVREGEFEKIVKDNQGIRFFSLYQEKEFKDVLKRNDFDLMDYSRDERGKNHFSTGYLCYLVKNIK